MTVSESQWPRLRDEFDRLIGLFVAGNIGEPTLEVSLQRLGFRGQSLAAEVSLARSKKADARPTPWEKR